MLAANFKENQKKFGWTQLADYEIVGLQNDWHDADVNSSFEAAMMDVSPTYLRFFFASCCFGIVIGVMGCATNNWSQPLFNNRSIAETSREKGQAAEIAEIAEASDRDSSPQREPIKAPKSFWKQGFGEMSGIDPRSREIERSLGF